ncbi:hypothetical protein EJC47_06690 [Sphingomonas sp. TF3]|uniref:hypothetical protein n=1 Tax=Sphingomonas sp. TF3 TaxID=2495580 RepID=UPI000F85DECA|nr:hypothetical protein [Sphingomonas sp. TF3]RUN77176.1 hypothetical protein EJC47_06690 [Sphingomonas sp. TF3]
MKTLVLVCFLLAGCEAARAPVPTNPFSETEARSAKEPKPSVRLVNEVEERVRQLPCVGDLSDWNRDYRYDLRGSKIDTTMVFFVLIEGDDKSKRKISQPHDSYDVPSGKYRLVAGVFDTTAKTVKVEECGELVEGPTT